MQPIQNRLCLLQGPPGPGSLFELVREPLRSLPVGFLRSDPALPTVGCPNTSSLGAGEYLQLIYPVSPKRDA